MQVIEQFIQAKNGDMTTCEDGYIYNENFVAVVDGATNKSGILYDQESPGRIAMTLAIKAIEQLDPTINAHTAFNHVNQALHNYYTKRGILEAVTKNPPSRCTASCVIYSVFRHELWFLGDCMALVDNHSVQFQKETDSVLSNLRALLIHVAISQGTTVNELLEHDTCREQIIPFLNQQAILQNSAYESDFTYYALDGITSIPKNHIHVTPLSPNTKEIVLSSDGYPSLKPTLQATEDHLAYILQEDPLCYTLYRSTKGLVQGNLSYDDRVYVRFTR